MLVLTRKRFEEIHIGNNVVIKVIKTGRNTVKLGIEAPATVRVLRAELSDKPDPCPRQDAEELAVCSDQFPQFA